MVLREHRRTADAARHRQRWYRRRTLHDRDYQPPSLPPPPPPPSPACPPELAPFLEELGVSWVTRKLIDAGKNKWTLSSEPEGFEQIITNSLGNKHYKYKVRWCRVALGAPAPPPADHAPPTPPTPPPPPPPPATPTFSRSFSRRWTSRAPTARAH